jgi:YegS/Rv2252/BmrU family lipid kinase
MLAGRGLELRVARTESAAHAAMLAREAAEAGEEVVAFGGDGIVRVAAHAARLADAVLGIIPGGRGNDFASVLGIPRRARTACEVVAEGVVRTVDCGEVGGQTFVGVASIGLESEVTALANAAPRVGGALGGELVYLGATFVGLARWQPATFTVRLDGETRAFTGYLAAAASSGRFGGGMRIAPDARLDDGMLDFVALEHQSKLRCVLKTPTIYRGTHVRDRAVQVARAREVRLEADRPFDVYADGDPIGATPAIARALPGALRVRAPRHLR